MKKTFERALQEKKRQRTANAARPVSEKFAMLDRLKQRSDALKQANKAKGGQPLKSGR